MSRRKGESARKIDIKRKNKYAGKNNSMFPPVKSGVKIRSRRSKRKKK